MRLLAIIFICFFVVWAITAFVLWRAIARWIERRRRARLVRLEQYHQRLRGIVSALLARADEIDQESRFSGADGDAAWSNRLAVTCKELVVLGDDLSAIDSALKMEDVQAGEQHIVRSCRLAVKLSKELQAIRLIGSDASPGERGKRQGRPGRG